MARRHLVELREDGLLDRHPLGDRLDHEVDVAEALVLRRARDPPDDLLELPVGLLLVDLLLADEAPELRLGHLASLLEALVDELLVDVLQHDGNLGGRDHLGDLPSHRAGAYDGGFEYEHAVLQTWGPSPADRWAARRPRRAEGYSVEASLDARHASATSDIASSNPSALPVSPAGSDQRRARQGRR